MDRARSAYRAGLTLLLAAAVYEAIARSGAFPPALLPTLPKVASTLWTLLLDGTMLEHAAYTMYRVLFGLALAIAVGLPLGILMGALPAGREFLSAARQRADADPVARLGAGVHPLVRARQHGRDPHRVLRRAVSHAAQCLVGRARGQSAVAARGRRHGRRRARAVLEGDHSRRLAVHHHRACARPSCAPGSRSWAPRCSPPPTGAWAG